jgi:CIC family chloride channel protein
VLLRSIAIARGIARRLPLAPWLHPATAGLLVGLVALEFPEILGVGYEATDNALFSNYALWNLIVLIALKTAATAVCLGAGFGGGIFSPSLFIGAMLGGAYGIIATSAFPELSSGHGAYSLIGMGAVAGATLGAPISTILMIFELTGDYALTVAVMLATVIATLVTRQSHGHSFFTWQLAERGITISGGQDIGLLRSIKTRSVMTGIYSTIGPETPLATLRDRLEEAHWGKLLVVDEEGRLEGIVTFSELHGLAFDTSRDGELSARDVARQHPTALLADDDLETAVTVFGATGEAHLPVIADRESRRLLGIAHEHEVFLAYHRALSDAQAG